MEKYDLINMRAEILYELLDDLITYSGHEVKNNAIDALKATFVLRERSISRFQQAFASFGLCFDICEVEDFYENFSSELPGPTGMMSDEKRLLEEVLTRIN